MIFYIPNFKGFSLLFNFYSSRNKELLKIQRLSIDFFPAENTVHKKPNKFNFLDNEFVI
jgi:hypothetical protein